MAIISYDFGHMEGNGGVCQDTSANGYLYEYKVNREYGQICVDVLKNAGHTLVNCTPADNSCSTLGQSLSYRANKSNQSGAVLHLCFHANCYDDESAHGAEVEYSSSTGAKYAQSVLNEICKLGFASRGIKNPALYMTGSHVNAVSILLEPFFISNKNECNIYNPITLGNAVAKGVLNIIGGTYNPSSGVSTTSSISTEVPTSATTNTLSADTIKLIQNDLNRIGIKDNHGNKLVEDGIWGLNTTGAMSNFQYVMGLSTNGQYNSNTCVALNELFNKPTLQVGSKGYSVKYLQWYLGCDSDGIFGSNTKAKVIAWQTKVGLVADGIVGQKSWNKIF